MTAHTQIAAETQAEGIRRHMPAALANMRQRYPAAPEFRVREHARAMAEMLWAAERSRRPVATMGFERAPCGAIHMGEAA